MNINLELQICEKEGYVHKCWGEMIVNWEPSVNDLNKMLVRANQYVDSLVELRDLLKQREEYKPQLLQEIDI